MLSRAAALRPLTRSLRFTPATCEDCLRSGVIPTRLSPPPGVNTTLVPIRRYAAVQMNAAASSSKQNHRPGKQPSHKPPKRRLEAASQPLRNAPSSTRGPVLQCVAHTTAERYDLTNLGYVLRTLGVRWDEVPEGSRDRAFVIGPWKGRGGAERLISGKDVRRIHHHFGSAASASVGGGPEEDMEMEDDSREPGFGYGDRGEIWVFNSGSFVTWGLTEEEGRAFLREVIRRKGAGVEKGGLTNSEYEVEEVDFVVDPTAQTHIMGNLILLGAPPSLSTYHHSMSLASLLTRYTLSLALTRSSALSVLEDRLDAHIASVSTLPLALSRYGAQPMNRREVIRKIGELMSLRMAVNTTGGGLDETPEFYWSEPALEEYFDSITSEFEIKERIETINKKIDYAQEIQSTLRALLTEASGHRMEIIIIALIAVEVVLALIREGPELNELVVQPALGSLSQMMGIETARRTRTERAQHDGTGGVHGYRHDHGAAVDDELRGRREGAEPLLAGEIRHLTAWAHNRADENRDGQTGEISKKILPWSWTRGGVGQGEGRLV